MNLKNFFIAAVSLACLSSCGIFSYSLTTDSVAYQSIRPVNYKSEVPQDAKIACAYTITDDGKIVVAVANKTDEIMIIDQTKSFLVNSNGVSNSYYDPTVRVTSETSSSSVTQGESVNLGAVAGALGIGGALGTLASGINVGGYDSGSYSTTNTTYFADQPQISLGPRGSGLMSKEYSVLNVGRPYLSTSSARNNAYTPSNSYCKFSVCISYSLDGGLSFDKVVTDFYVNSIIVCPVENYGKVNAALRKILSSKSDCFNEDWWLLRFNNNLYEGNNIMFNGGVFTDYR